METTDQGFVNPFAGKTAEQRAEVWKQMNARRNPAPPETADDHAAYERLKASGTEQATFSPRACIFAGQHGWKGGTTAQACGYIEQNQLVEAFASFLPGTGLRLDVSQLPRNPDGSVQAS